MDLRKLILTENTKQNGAIISSWIGTSQERFDQLFFLFLNDNYRVVQRAAGPVIEKVKERPGFIGKHFSIIIKTLQKDHLPIAIQRNILRLLPHTDIPIRYQGYLMETCMKSISLPQESIAIKLYALIILQRLCFLYPEILPEISIALNDCLPQQTSSFRSKANKILAKKIYKDLSNINGD
ncbi:MAG: hypothetical protein NVS1B13_19890 [Flavisolibacter sp.]